MSSINLNTYQRWKRTYYKRKDVRVYTNSVLILISFSVLVLLAIQPTIVTILNLRQRIKSSRELVERMDRKIKVLSRLEDQYLEILDYLPLMQEVFPEEASGAYLGRVVKVYAYKHNLTVKTLNLSGYKWPYKNQVEKTKTRQISYYADVVLGGEYQDIIDFMKELEQMRLLIGIESFNLKAFKNETLLTARIALKSWYD